MNVVRMLLALCLAVCLTATVGADNKPKPKDKDKAGSVDKAKLVGTWEVTDGGTAGDKGTTYEFTKDGKITVSAKKKKGLSGTYKIDSDSISWKIGTAAVSAETPPMKVTKLTDKELVLEDVAGQKTTMAKK